MRAHQSISIHLAAALLGALAVAGCAADELHPVSPPGSSTPVVRLSQLGIFEGDPAKQVPGRGFVAYDVNVSLYADSASKHRFIFVPPGKRVHVTADRWEMPEGVYLVKTFAFPVDARDPALGERLVETRILVKTQDGFRGATYVWNSEQTDAIFSRGDLDVPVKWIDRQGTAHDERFHVPASSDCSACHQGRPLGWRSRQLDHAGSYPDGTDDQISHLLAAGVIDARPPAHPVLADPFGDASLDARARSYLDVNCSHCHSRGGIAERTGLLWDLEHTSASARPACRATAPVDGRDRVLVPGHPEQSEFLARMVSADPSVKMPRGPITTPDRAGLKLLESWVAAMPPTTCPR